MFCKQLNLIFLSLLAAGCGQSTTDVQPANRRVPQDTNRTANPPSGITQFEEVISASDESRLALKQQVRQTAGDLVAQGRLFSAVELLQQFLDSEPNHADLRADLAGLQLQIGLQEDSAVHLQWLVQHGHAGAGELVALCDLSRPQVSIEMCRQSLNQQPSDLRPMLGLVRLAMFRGQWDSARQMCDAMLESQSEFLPAQIYRHAAMVRQDDLSSINRVLQSEPIPAYYQSAEATSTWALLANQHKDFEAAVRWASLAISVDPNHRQALSVLVDSAAGCGQSSLATAAAQRLKLLESLSQHVERYLTWKRTSQSAAMAIADVMRQLGRHWESVSWARLATVMPADPVEDLPLRLEPFRSLLNASTPWQQPLSLADPYPTGQSSISELAALWADLKKLETQNQIVGSDDINDSPSPKDSFSLVDESQRRGLSHITKIQWNGPEPPSGSDSPSGLWIWQSSVGGAGIIDFDNDGWDDVLLTNADGLPTQRNSSANVLYRNLNGYFEARTSDDSGNPLGDVGFTQGVAIGDYNEDGFEDCYVCNIGQDRLYRNNGDGSFADVTSQVLPELGEQLKQPNLWTSSAALADVNLDGLTDLFRVHYCSGLSPYQQKCYAEGQNEHRSCQPLTFDAGPDELLLGDPSGIFDPRSRLAGDTEPGRGLGLMIGQLDDVGGMDIYVANDMTANHWWNYPIAESDTQQQRMVDQAFIRGVAISGRSVSQASMGIAANDLDGDGDLDLFVTHFEDDHNTAYEQIGSGRYRDSSAAWGVVEPSQPMLGFGVAAVDLNLDGHCEILIANGHVDRMNNDSLFEMPMQLMVRTAKPQPVYQLATSSVGDYFDRPGLRRAIVRSDFDHDGRLDVVVSGLNESSGLLMNRTKPVGRPISVRLVGTKCSRDAVGAVVTLRAGDFQQTQYRLAGNGYQCSDDPKLHFAIPDGVDLNRIEIFVVWPDGDRQTISSTDCHVSVGGTQWLVVQTN